VNFTSWFYRIRALASSLLSLLALFVRGLC